MIPLSKEDIELLKTAIYVIADFQKRIPAKARLEIWRRMPDGFCTTCGEPTKSVSYINRCHCKELH